MTALLVGALLALAALSFVLHPLFAGEKRDDPPDTKGATCPKCGPRPESDARFCSRCGAPLERR